MDHLMRIQLLITCDGGSLAERDHQPTPQAEDADRRATNGTVCPTLGAADEDRAPALWFLSLKRIMQAITSVMAASRAPRRVAISSLDSWNLPRKA